MDFLVQRRDFWFNWQFWCKARQGRGGLSPPPPYRVRGRLWFSSVQGKEDLHPHLNPLPSRERRTLTPTSVSSTGQALVFFRLGKGGLSPSPQSSPVKGEEDSHPTLAFFRLGSGGGGFPELAVFYGGDGLEAAIDLD